MSARIAEIKRQLRAYGIPLGIRTIKEPMQISTGVPKLITLKAAWLSVNPDIHLEPEYRWVSDASMGRYGATWEQAWEELLDRVRRKLLDEIKLIERERRFEGKKYL